MTHTDQLICESHSASSQGQAQQATMAQQGTFWRGPASGLVRSEDLELVKTGSNAEPGAEARNGPESLDNPIFAWSPSA